MEKKIVIQGICYDEKSSFQKGPSKAPPLIRTRYWSDAYNHFAENGKEIDPRVLDDRGDFMIRDYWDIHSITKDHLKISKNILTLGGDHSITYPIVKAFSEFHEPFTIVHIDAHGDLYDIYDGDKYSHACPFARIMEEKLVNRLVQIGIRTLNTHQRKQADRYGVEIIEMKDFNINQIPSITGPVYLSLDLDGIDPAYAPGVSHQESGGLTTREVIRIIHSLGPSLIGADIVEYNPDNDVGGITAALSAKLMKEIFSMIL